MNSIQLIITATSDSTAPPPSAEEIAGNIDLVTEILLHLPIKSLIKFKSVSKQWLSLISDPKFSLRRSPSPSSPSGLFLQRSSSDELYFVGLTPTPSRPPFRSITLGSNSGIKIAHSCNGLLLCYKASVETDETTRNYFVYNPTTNRYTVLPLPPRTQCTEITIYGITLAFDPSKSRHYKAVCVRNFSGEETQFEIEIYSSETGLWRQSALGFFCAEFDTHFGSGVFWNGCVYWMNPWDPLLCFDVGDEWVRRSPMPPLSDGMDGTDRDFAYFAESGDHLHFVDYFLKSGEVSFKVYEMERDCSGWFVKYVVDTSQVSKAFPEVLSSPHYCDLLVLCVVRCAVEEESFLVMKLPGKVLRYNFRDGTFCKIFDVPIKDARVWVLESTEPYQFIESLASV